MTLNKIHFTTAANLSSDKIACCVNADCQVFFYDTTNSPVCPGCWDVSEFKVENVTYTLSKE